MRNKYLLFILFCLLSALSAPFAHAQANFRPGYVLPLTGDTVRGEVDSREGRLNAQRCRFRATAGGAVTTYAPAELRGYGFTAENRFYRSLPITIAPAGGQSYFMEVLADGPASLYFLRDAEQHESYYVVSPKLPLTLLEHGSKRTENGNRVYMQELTGYRTTLIAALANCPAVQNQLPSLPFQEEALRRVVIIYNISCAGGAAPRAQPAPAKLRATLGIMAGVARQKLSYGNGIPFGFDISSSHTGYIVGPMLTLSSTRASQRLSLVVAALYEPEKYVIEGVGKVFAAGAGTYFRHSFDLGYLRVPVMIRYTYPRGKVAPFAEAGFTMAYATKANTVAEELNSKGVFIASQTQIAGPTGDNFRSFQAGLGGSLGLSSRLASGRSVSLLVRTELANGFNGISGSSNSVLHLYGLLSFDLTK